MVRLVMVLMFLVGALVSCAPKLSSYDSLLVSGVKGVTYAAPLTTFMDALEQVGPEVMTPQVDGNPLTPWKVSNRDDDKIFFEATSSTAGQGTESTETYSMFWEVFEKDGEVNAAFQMPGFDDATEQRVFENFLRLLDKKFQRK